MQFILRGFCQVQEFRVFTFEGIASDRTRTPFTVRTDLALARRYGIHLQELPLLCRAVLERRLEGEENTAFTYSEQDMCIHADSVAAREELRQKRRPPRRPITEQVGAAWRVPPR